MDSVRTNFNVFSFYSLLSRASSFSLSVLLGTIRIPKVGPKPCNIVRKWLAGHPPRGLPKWHYLNEFFTVHGLARSLQIQKFNLISVPGFVWLGRAAWCKLNPQNTQIHQNVDSDIDKWYRLSRRSNAQLFYSDFFFPLWRKFAKRMKL